jgi:hypothetical protein
MRSVHCIIAFAIIGVVAVGTALAAPKKKPEPESEKSAHIYLLCTDGHDWCRGSEPRWLSRLRDEPDEVLARVAMSGLVLERR